MASPETLIAGNCCFFVGYYNRQLLFPNVNTLEYLRKDKTEEGHDVWFFKNPRLRYQQILVIMTMSPPR